MTRTFSIFFFIFFNGLFAQELKLDNISAGAGINIFIPKNDLGKFWKAKVNPVLSLKYEISKSIAIETEAGFSKFKPKENKTGFPDIDLMVLSAGLRLAEYPAEFVYLFASGGIKSYTFYFKGSNAAVSGNNPSESEFGFYFSGGLGFLIYKNISAETSFGIQNIFSYPESLIMLNSRILLFYRL